jgi:hypothetical protein
MHAAVKLYYDYYTHVQIKVSNIMIILSMAYVVMCYTYSSH